MLAKSWLLCPVWRQRGSTRKRGSQCRPLAKESSLSPRMPPRPVVIQLLVVVQRSASFTARKERQRSSDRQASPSVSLVQELNLCLLMKIKNQIKDKKQNISKENVQTMKTLLPLSPSCVLPGSYSPARAAGPTVGCKTSGVLESMGGESGPSPYT